MNTLRTVEPTRLDPAEHAPRLTPSYPQTDNTPVREQFAQQFGFDVTELFESGTPAAPPRWPVDESGKPRSIGELSEPERRGWFARGLRTMILEFEIADAAHRARLERW